MQEPAAAVPDHCGTVAVKTTPVPADGSSAGVSSLRAVLPGRYVGPLKEKKEQVDQRAVLSGAVWLQQMKLVSEQLEPAFEWWMPLDSQKHSKLQIRGQGLESVAGLR